VVSGGCGLFRIDGVWVPAMRRKCAANAVVNHSHRLFRTPTLCAPHIHCGDNPNNEQEARGPCD
jgi:hypothetical protein